MTGETDGAAPGASPPGLRPLVVPPETSRVTGVMGRSRAVALAADTGDRFALLHSELEEGPSAPLHVHTEEDEAWIVMDGDLELKVSRRPCDPTGPAPEDLQRHLAGVGSFVFVPRGYAHRLRARSARASVWTLLVPGGLESFVLQRERGEHPAPDGFGVTIWPDASGWDAT